MLMAEVGKFGMNKVFESVGLFDYRVGVSE